MESCIAFLAHSAVVSLDGGRIAGSDATTTTTTMMMLAGCILSGALSVVVCGLSCTNSGALKISIHSLAHGALIARDALEQD